ncbi:DUF6814 family protein [Spirosoma telluris]|uniref:DUF6814 family protein n=1 Tax=Spirosoma telluris TaxID=2183553 RepID=UPI0038CD60A1
MKAIKKYMGIVWILMGVLVAYNRITDSLIKIGSDKLEDRVFGWVVLLVLVPIVVGGSLPSVAMHWLAITTKNSCREQGARGMGRNSSPPRAPCSPLTSTHRT